MQNAELNIFEKKNLIILQEGGKLEKSRVSCLKLATIW